MRARDGGTGYEVDDPETDGFPVIQIVGYDRDFKANPNNPDENSSNNQMRLVQITTVGPDGGQAKARKYQLVFQYFASNASKRGIATGGMGRTRREAEVAKQQRIAQRKLERQRYITVPSATEQAAQGPIYLSSYDLGADEDVQLVETDIVTETSVSGLFVHVADTPETKSKRRNRNNQI